MSRIIFVNRYYDPDHSATAQLLTDLAVSLAAGGVQVAVVTSRQRYDRPEAALAARERRAGVDVFRVATSRFGRGRLPGRVLDYLSFYLSAAVTLTRLVRAGDSVVFKTDPPLMSALLWPIVRLKKAQYFNWLQDIFPEVAGVLGALPAALVKILRPLRNAALRRARSNVVIGATMAARLKAEGIPESGIRIIANWCDTRAIRPRDPADNPLRRKWDLENKFVVAHSGNLGRAHPIAAIEAAMQALAGEADVVFLLIGGGYGLEKLRAAPAGRGANVRFQPYQPRELLAESLTAADLHLVVLDPDLEGLMVPSKYAAVAAAGRACLFLGSADGELGGMISAAGSGRIIAPDDGAGLARAILELRDSPNQVSAYGACARRLAEASFDREHALAQWRALLPGGHAGSGQRSQRQ